MSKNEDNRKPILMPVEALNFGLCMSCPELDIVNHQVEFYCCGKTIYENHLKCSHYDRCERLQEHFNTH